MKKIRVKFEGPVLTEEGTPVPLLFDCPWLGHDLDPALVLRNASAPNVLGRRCVKCGCLIYMVIEQSAIVNAAGQPLAQEGTTE